MKQLLTTLLALILLLSCKKTPEKTHPLQEKITESVYASGIVKSRNQYQVFSAVNGLVKQVFVTEGDLVRKGDPILRLSDNTARLNTENARLAEEYAASNADKLNQSKIDIDLAKARLDNESSLLQKQRSLWQQGIGSQNELDQRELAHTNAVDAYNAAKLRYTDLQKQLNFQLRQSQKNLQLSTTVAGDFTVKSEVNGRVYDVVKEVGEMVNIQTPVAIIGDAAGFMLELQVDEYDITRVKLGQKLLLRMDSYKGQVFEAKVDKIDPIMNAQSKSFTVEASFINPAPTLYPNLTVEANIIIQVKDRALTIPRNYLLDSNYVLLATKEKRKVITGLKDYQKVEIVSCLTANDIILKPE